MKKLYKDIGRKVRQLREDKGISQFDLAKAIGYKSRVTVSKIESGEYTISAHILKKLSDFFTVSSSYFLEDKSDNFEKDLYSYLLRDKKLTKRDADKVIDYLHFVKEGGK